MRIVITLIASIGLVAGTFSQPLTIDSTFQPFFDIRCCGAFAGSITSLHEDQTTGKLYMSGDFSFSMNNQSYNGYASMQNDGSYNGDFLGSSFMAGPFSAIFPMNDSVFALEYTGDYIPIDTNGAIVMVDWRTNYRKTIRCSASNFPYFYSDGSSLMSNGLGNPGSCTIIVPPDTFPHRYIVKIDPQGYWDSTFSHEGNFHVNGFIPYDSTRIFVFGIPARLTHYDGKRVNGFFRIFLDGTLDTTFKVVLADTLGNYFSISNLQSDGSFFLTGYGFSLQDYPGQRFHLVKFNADGSVDTSFKMHHQLKELNYVVGVNNIVTTPDGGYIISGNFDSIQGYPKHNLAKLDSSGNLEPQYFNTHGPDTSHWQGAGMEWIRIEKSAFGGYYAYGDFISWDGKATQPIVRLKGLTTGVRERTKNDLKVQLFPNPSSGLIKISTTADLQSIAVYNLQGHKVQEIPPKTRSWQLPEENGFYLIRLHDANGNIYTEKVIRTN